MDASQEKVSALTTQLTANVSMMWKLITDSGLDYKKHFKHNFGCTFHFLFKLWTCSSLPLNPDWEVYQLPTPSLCLFLSLVIKVGVFAGTGDSWHIFSNRQYLLQYFYSKYFSFTTHKVNAKLVLFSAPFSHTQPGLFLQGTAGMRARYPTVIVLFTAVLTGNVRVIT